ncbi:hypothetical protein VMC_29820 [Vibrio alginolyticus 40B]|nr:hypothetical protein VMC_29820 [Vibrio alginolyticus 40B]
MACSNQQASQLGMRSSSVNVYAQQMSNTQLCETLYYNRATNQTKVAIGAEFNRRGLNKKWCDKEFDKLYIKKWIDNVLPKEKAEPKKPMATIQPAPTKLTPPPLEADGTLVFSAFHFSCMFDATYKNFIVSVN